MTAPQKRKASAETEADAEAIGQVPESYLKPLTDVEVRELGFDPTPRGWQPQDPDVAERVSAAARRIGPGAYTDPIPFRVPGPPVECSVCDGDAEPSIVGTPVCGEICAAVLMHQLVAAIAAYLWTEPDGSGGTDPVHPITPRRSRPALSVAPTGPFSVDRARERLGDCRTVLERYGARVRGRMAFCPFHPNEKTPAMSLYEKAGNSRAHCHACSWDGDSIDLEAALADEDLRTTIRRNS